MPVHRLRKKCHVSQLLLTATIATLTGIKELSGGSHAILCGLIAQLNVHGCGIEGGSVLRWQVEGEEEAVQRREVRARPIRQN